MGFVGGVGSVVPTVEASFAVEPLTIRAGDFEFDALSAGPVDGPLVILLHGFPQSSHEWRHQLPVLAELGFRAVAPDQRGYSPGARPPDVVDYAVSELVGDVIGIADTLGSGSFHLIGHDWGAVVAWVTAITFPNRVESLVAMSVPHPQAWRDALVDPEGEQMRRLSYTQALVADDAEDAFMADNASKLRRFFGNSGLGDDETPVYIDLLSQPGAFTAATNWYRCMAQQQTSNPLPSVEVPTLYIWSTEDPAVAAATAHKCAEHVAGPYRFETLQGVGHWIPENATDEVNKLLTEHFQNTP